MFRSRSTRPTSCWPRSPSPRGCPAADDVVDAPRTRKVQARLCSQASSSSTSRTAWGIEGLIDHGAPFFRAGQAQSHGGSLPGLRSRRRNVPPVFSDDTGRDRKTETGSARLAPGGEKGLGEPGQVLRGDAGSLVARPPEPPPPPAVVGGCEGDRLRPDRRGPDRRSTAG